MAGEIQFPFQTGKACYFLVRNRNGQVWNTSGTGGFESYQTANYSSYGISAVEQGDASQMYVGNFPSAIPAGVYGVVSKQRIAGSGVEGDPNIAGGEFQWNGTTQVPLSDLVTSGSLNQAALIRITRGTMVRNFPIYLKSAADHITPFTSGVVSGQISRDGGSFGPLESGAFTEMGLGWFNLQALTSGDLLANSVALLFTAAGISGGGNADPLPLAIVMQRSSGQ